MSLLRLLQTDLIFMSLCSKPLGCLLVAMSLLRLLQTDLIFMSRRSKPLVWLIAAMSLLHLLQQARRASRARLFRPSVRLALEKDCVL